jgi:predicted negative regulator of RcsB-dependent stress response
MLSKILFAFIIVGSVVGYSYKMTTESKMAEMQSKLQTQANLITAFETREAEQVRTIEALQNNLQKTTEALNTMSTKNAEIEAEAQRYLSIFARHNLSKLAAAKPGLIETRINKGTLDVFRTIEKDTTDIDAIDN